MKRITVTKETATGRNVSFHDNYTGNSFMIQYEEYECNNDF